MSIKIAYTELNSVETLRCLILVKLLGLDVQLEKVNYNSHHLLDITVDNQKIFGFLSLSWFIKRYQKMDCPVDLNISLKNQNYYEIIFFIISKVDNILMNYCEYKKYEVVEELNNLLLTHYSNVNEKLTLVDIYLWTSFYGKCQEFLDEYKHLSKHIKNIQNKISHILIEYKTFIDEICLYDITPQKKVPKMYITTAIHYTNASPHIGHAYESVIADIIARFARFFGKNVFLLTGTDEHGQKIERSAQNLGIPPIELCNKISKEFQDLFKILNISYDGFIRTTNSCHKEMAQKIWLKCEENNDIYLGEYIGWYNIREESFVTEKEAQLLDYKDPVTGKPLERTQEESFFFRASKYQSKLIDHIVNHKEFIQPESRRNEILVRLEDPLEDVSCSRNTFSWGIQIPNEPNHVMYVWFDALCNYLSGIQYSNNVKTSDFWPADLHVIGRDITWFHSVIWPCILMSCGMPLPTTILTHGFILDSERRKMSKSFGNVVDTLEIIKLYNNSDFLRFFFIKFTEVGRDLSFDLNALVDVYNSELANTIGNLVHRGTGLSEKYCNGQVPQCDVKDYSHPFDYQIFKTKIHECIERYALQECLDTILWIARDTNKYLTDKAPWTEKNDLTKKKICRVILESLYYIAHYLFPFIPIASENIFKKLNSDMRDETYLSPMFDNLTPLNFVTPGDILFQKIKK